MTKRDPVLSENTPLLRGDRHASMFRIGENYEVDVRYRMTNLAMSAALLERMAPEALGARERLTELAESRNEHRLASPQAVSRRQLSAFGGWRSDIGFAGSRQSERAKSSRTAEILMFSKYNGMGWWGRLAVWRTSNAMGYLAPQRQP
jgi:hypothetical protein